jgi:C4-type Zn-finger protein
MNFNIEEVQEFPKGVYTDDDWKKYNEKRFEAILEWLSKIKSEKNKVAIVYNDFVGLGSISYVTPEPFKKMLYIKKEDKFFELDMSQEFGTAIEAKSVPEKYFIIDFENNLQYGTETEILVGYSYRGRKKIFKNERGF